MILKKKLIKVLLASCISVATILVFIPGMAFAEDVPDSLHAFIGTAKSVTVATGTTVKITGTTNDLYIESVILQMKNDATGNVVYTSPKQKIERTTDNGPWSVNFSWLADKAGDYTATLLPEARMVSPGLAETKDAETDNVVKIKVVDQYTVTAKAATGGTVTGGGTFKAGESCTVNATPKKGYAFKNWTDAEGKVVATSKSYEFNVSADTTLTANFKAASSTSDKDSTGNSKESGDSPATGDSSTFMVWMSIMLMAGASLSGLGIYRKMKN